MGTLTGNGTFATPTLVNNGTVAPTGPNNTTGTLTINGNYQQNPSGTLDAEVGGPQSSQADLLNVSGTATLSGVLNLTSLNNFHPSPGDTYTILAAPGVTGNFSQVLDPLNTSGLTLVEVIAPNGIVVSFLRPAPAPTPMPPTPSHVAPPPPPTVVATTPNPLPPPPLSNTEKNAILVPIVNPDAEQLSSLYETWFSGANTQRFNIEDRFDNIMAGSTGFVSNVSYPRPPPTGKEVTEGKGVVEGKESEEAAPSPLQPVPENRWGIWVTGFGDFVNVDNDGSTKGYGFTTGGVTVGIDYRLTRNFVIGLMGGYSHTWTGLNPTGSIDVDTGWGGAYAGYFDHGFYLDGAIFGGHYTFESVRQALFGDANGSSDGSEFSTFVATGYDFHFGQLTIGPTAALQYTYASLNGFNERGSVAPLTVSSDSQNSLRTDLGFRTWYDIHARQATVRPFLRAAWEHEYLYSALPISANLVDIPSSPVTILGPSLGHDSAVINAGLSVQWSPRLSAYVSYDGQLGRSRYNSNGVSGGFKYAFY
jgi:outer membrane autotransporter protein